MQFDAAIADQILESLADGITLREMCKAAGMPDRRTVFRWRLDREDFAKAFDVARMTGFELIAEELLEISDDGRNDWMQRQDPDNPGWNFNGEHVQRSRLRADTRKWMLAKMLPKVYGDAMALKHSDPDGNPLTVQIVRFTDPAA
jgi:hypothetical protein